MCQIASLQNSGVGAGRMWMWCGGASATLVHWVLCGGGSCVTLRDTNICSNMEVIYGSGQ